MRNLDNQNPRVNPGSIKNALVFIDGDAIKVIFGSSLKVIRLKEVELEHNIRFIDKLFADHRVLFVSSASEIDMADLVAGIDKKLASGDREKASSSLPSSAVVGMSVNAPQSGLPPVTRPAQRSVAPVAGGQWIKSNAKTIIIIDDLLTNDELAPGIKKALSLPPNRAVNLATLDPDKVANSVTMRALIQNGTISFTDPGEALHLEHVYESRVREENDARLSQYAPIVGDGSVGSARALASQGVQDGGLHDTPMMEISGDFPDVATPEDSGSMTTLMEMMREQAEVDIPEDDAAPAPRRKLAERPKVDVDPAKGARRIGKRHAEE